MAAWTLVPWLAITILVSFTVAHAADRNFASALHYLSSAAAIGGVFVIHRYRNHKNVREVQIGIIRNAARFAASSPKLTISDRLASVTTLLNYCIDCHAAARSKQARSGWRAAFFVPSGSNSHELRIVASVRIGKNTPAEYVSGFGSGQYHTLALRCWNERTPMISRDALRDSRVDQNYLKSQEPSERFIIRSLACELVSSMRIDIGVLCLDHSWPNTFGKRESFIREMFADLTGIVFEGQAHYYEGDQIK